MGTLTLVKLADYFIGQFFIGFTLHTIYTSSNPVITLLTSILPFLVHIRLERSGSDVLPVSTIVSRTLSCSEDKSPRVSLLRRTMFVLQVISVLARYYYSTADSLFITNSVFMLMVPIYHSHSFSMLTLFSTNLVCCLLFAQEHLIGKMLTFGVFLEIFLVPLFCGVALVITFSFHTKGSITAIQLANERLKSASNAKSMFLSTIGHEVRTPLNAILACVDLLAEQKLTISKEQYKLVKTIMNCGSSLLATLNSILSFVKLEQTRITEKLTLTTVDLKNFVNTLVDMMSITAKKKGLNVYKDWCPISQYPSLFQADENRLREVLVNLLSNSLKYTDKGSVGIHISMDKTNNPEIRNVCFEIRDTGVGIPNDFLDYMFQPFSQRASNGRTGTGLGLAISKKQVELMNGSITFRSKIGMGTSFFVRIPLALSPEEKNQAKCKQDSTDLSKAEAGRIRVLAVDDNTINIKVMTRMSQQLGLNIMCVSSGEEAIDLITRHNEIFDFIFMDYDMPQKNGVETIQVIQEHFDQHAHLKLPIMYIVSGCEQSIFADVRDQLKIQGFLQKPFRLECLKMCILQGIHKQASIRTS